MEQFRIPHTTLDVSVLCFGTGHIGSVISRADSFRMLDRFVERGGTFIDTARIYADWLPGERSISEKTIGAWLRERGGETRRRVALATKGGHPPFENMAAGRLSQADLTADLEGSLLDLGVDCIDLYWLHRDDPSLPVEEILASLEGFRRAGKIRYYACSNWKLARILQARLAANVAGWQGFVANQMLWSLAEANLAALSDPTLVSMTADLYAFHSENQFPALAYTPLANGYFQKLAAGQAERISAGQRAVYDTPGNALRLGRAMQLAAQTGWSLTQVQLGYILSQPFPGIPILGARTFEQLEDSLSAASARLTPEQLQFLSVA